MARLDQLEAAEQLDLVQTIAQMIGLLEQTIRAEGFNVGLNLGQVAGTGLPGSRALAYCAALAWRHELHARPIRDSRHSTVVAGALGTADRGAQKWPVGAKFAGLIIHLRELPFGGNQDVNGEQHQRQHREPQRQPAAVLQDGPEMHLGPQGLEGQAAQIDWLGQQPVADVGQADQSAENSRTTASAVAITACRLKLIAQQMPQKEIEPNTQTTVLRKQTANNSENPKKTANCRSKSGMLNR